MSLEEDDDKRELRKVSDARTLRALAHPVRLAIIETLTVEGAMTATEVGERIGESPTTCSFHLRQLAKYGFVEEAGGGKGRARPWRMTSIGMHIRTDKNDPESEIAANALARLAHERSFRRFDTWQETSHTFPREWQDAAVDSEFAFYLTAEELRQLNDDLAARYLRLFRERLDPAKRPPGSALVEMLMFAFPISRPSPGGAE